MVSIIVPVYNGRTYIKDAIQSIKKQSYHNIEIIIIDDGSTDGLNSNDVLAIDSNIRFYSKPNSGLGMTRNLGMTLAKGNYLFFLDADDTLPYDAIERLRTSVEDNDFIIGQCVRVYINKNKQVYKQTIWKKNLFSQIHDKYHLIIDTIATNKLYKKDFLIQNNITFKEGLYEDKLFILKLFEHSSKFVYINKIVYFWHIYADGNSISNTKTIKNFKERIRVAYECIEYTNDEKMKEKLIENTIKHDFKVHLVESTRYSSSELREIYTAYKDFVLKYKGYIHLESYFVDKIILRNIENKERVLNEFKNISKENNTKNIAIKFKKYLRYSFYYIKVKFL